MDSDYSIITLPEDRTNWWVDRMYLQDAFLSAQHSEDPSTQVGCVLVLPNRGVVLSAWNAVPDAIASAGFPRTTDEKNYCTEHAERAVLFKALQNGLPTKGLWMYSTWSACSECARCIIQLGITKVVTLNRLIERTQPRWKDSIRCGADMMRLSGIRLVGWSGDLGVRHTIRFGGQNIGNEDLK